MKRDGDSDVICSSSESKPWFSTPGNPQPRKLGKEHRKTKSLPGKMHTNLKSPNQLISTFFKPISKSSDSEVEIMEPAGKATTSPTPSPVNVALMSPKKPLSPFKTIRMCSTSTKVVRPVMKIELSTDSGTEGPLSDIDDILSGSIPHLESHPMAEAVFNPSNKHLKEIMKKITQSEKEEKQTESAARQESEKNLKEKKAAETKVRPEPERKKVVKKVKERPQMDSSDSSCGKGRQRALIKKLPLTSRQIFHGRNWVPMTEFGKGEDEAECECEWVMDYTKNKLEDIVDLNSGEKTMMNLWNKHVNRYQVEIILSKVIFTNLCSRVVEQST